MKQWYEALFENFAKGYENEPYVKGTSGEVDFIEQEIGPHSGCTVLDIGCGTGRHAVELAKRGYKVTGVDLSEAQLAQARRNAAAAGVSVQFMQADARSLRFNDQFDAAIIICGGAFPLMETDEMNFRILKNAADALHASGTLILTTLNGLFPLVHSIKDFIASIAENEASFAHKFDLMTFRNYSEFKHTDDDGRTSVLHCNERYYVPSEITWLLKSAGFTSIEIYGAELGSWSRGRPLTSDNFEMLAIAKGLKRQAHA